MSQNHDIVFHLHKIGSITPIEALNRYGVFRLSARINNLRMEGYKISTAIVKENNKKFARYYLTE